MSKYVYPAIFTKEDKGYSVCFPDVQGCYTQGETLTEAMDMAKDALNLSFTLIRKYSQQLISNADKQGASKSREHITFISGRFSAFCYAVERHFRG